MNYPIKEDLLHPKFSGGGTPWSLPHFVDDGISCDCKHVYAEDGTFGSVCEVNLDNGLPIGNGGNDCPTKEAAVANARLIVSAPAMYMLLVYFYGYFSASEDTHKQDNCVLIEEILEKVIDG